MALVVLSEADWMVGRATLVDAAGSSLPVVDIAADGAVGDLVVQHWGDSKTRIVSKRTWKLLMLMRSNNGS